MNTQKDTQKTSLNSYGQSNVPDVKSFSNKHIYSFANKKTEKLVTALYMVTDCMDTDDALKSKLRQLGVELLSDMYKLSTLSPLDKYPHIATSLAHIDEVLSFVEIAYTVGFISEMNTAILKKEFNILIEELESHKKKDKHFTFTLDKQMFSLPILEEQTFSGIKDTKRTLNKTMSFTNRVGDMSLNNNLKTSNHSFSPADKQERINKILEIIKDKEASIKDISISFPGCSEKTIQRELNTLISKGQIKKTGSKRWSKYQAI